MLKRLITPFKPPFFHDDEEKTRRAGYTHTIALLFFVPALAYEVIIRRARSALNFTAEDFAILGIAFISLLCLWLVRRGYVSSASVLLVSMIWVSTNSIAVSFGVRDTSFIINFAIIIMAALLLGRVGSIIVGALSIVVALGLGNAESAGLIVPAQYAVSRFAGDISILIGLATFLIWILTNGLEVAIRRSQVNFKELEAANFVLNQTQADLHARSAQLTATNEALHKRAERLQAIADVANAATAEQNFDQLLPLLTKIVSSEFGFYHVGIFLIDAQRQYAILRAANTEGGLRMLAREHRLRVGEQGIVGYVTRTGTPRIALDVGQDAVYFNNPDLPDTRSELALPLKSGGVIIGALDIQSIKTNAFSEEDISTLSILADQVTIAIQNSISHEQLQRALQEARTASQQATGAAWDKYMKTLQTTGFRYDGIKPEPLTKASRTTDAQDALTVPVRVRGQTLGHLRLRVSDPLHKWSEDELAIIESTAERVAIAIDSARLLEEAQKQAARESFLSEIGTKLGASFQQDSILRDTVEELGQTLKGSTISFQLVNPSSPPPITPDSKNNGRISE